MNDTEEPHTPAPQTVREMYALVPGSAFNPAAEEMSAKRRAGFDRMIAGLIAAAHRAGREAIREEAAQTVFALMRDSLGAAMGEILPQLGQSIRALPLAPVEATPPETEDDPLPYSFGTGHGRSSTPTPYEGGPTGNFAPRPEFGPTPREGDNIAVG